MLPVGNISVKQSSMFCCHNRINILYPEQDNVDKISDDVIFLLGTSLGRFYYVDLIEYIPVGKYKTSGYIHVKAVILPT